MRYKWHILISVVLFYTIANFFHVLYSWIQSPPNTIFLAIPHYFPDYFYYLSQVTQGSLGAWMTKNLFTTDPIPAAPLWLHNIVIGKFSALFQTTPWNMYTIFLVSSAVISLVVIWFMIRFYIPNEYVIQQISAFIIAVSANSYFFPDSNAPFGLRTFGYFYNYTASLNRLGGVFHLIIQNSISLLCLYATIQTAQILKRTNNHNLNHNVFTLYF
jgi:hypothetical protein